MNILISNIGNRDLQHGLLKKFNYKMNRSAGKTLWENYKSEKAHFSLPILGQSLDMLQKQNIRIDTLWLFYTDQPETAGSFRDGDSVYTVKIVKRLILERYGNSVGEISLIPIQGQPNNYDEMYRFYENRIKNPPEPYSNAFVSVSGGIPACNMSLILHAITVFAEKLILLQVDEECTATPRQLRTGLELIRNYNRRAMHNMLDLYNFHGAAKILSGTAGDRELRCLANSANCRLMFDFEKSLSELKETDTAEFDKEDRRTVEDQIDLLNNLVKLKNLHICFGKDCSKEDCRAWFRFQEMCIAETLASAKIKYESGMYIDYLGRIFRIVESVGRLIFEKETGYSSIDRHNDPSSEFREFGETERGKQFRIYLKKMTYEANTLVFTKFISFLKKKEHKDEYQKILNVFKRLDKLKELRNKSIIAHGFVDITRQRIEEICPGHDDLLNEMSATLELNDNIIHYRQLADIIKKYF